MATFGSSITSPVISFDALGNLVGATEMAIINTSPSGVTPGTYGDASHTVQFTVTTYGDLTAAANVAIQLDASAIISGTLSALRLPSSGVTAASYGDATHVATFTVDATGRLTAAASVAITGAPPTGAAGGDLTGTYPNPTVGNTILAAYRDQSYAADKIAYATSSNSLAIASFTSVGRSVVGAATLPAFWTVVGVTVAIAGGTIDGTTVGATTPASVKATTLTTTGQVFVDSGTNTGSILAAGNQNIVNSTLSTVTQVGINSQIIGSSGAITGIRGINSSPSTDAAAFTCKVVASYWAAAATKGAGSTITRAIGVNARQQSIGTNNYGYLYTTDETAAPTGNYAFLNTTTDPSSFGGDVSVTGNLSVTGNAGFYGVTAVSQPGAEVDSDTAMANLGLKATGGSTSRRRYKVITNVNLNSANTDVATFSNMPAKWRPSTFLVFDASTSLTTATVDLRTATGGGGTALVSAASLSACTTATKITAPTPTATDYRTESVAVVRCVTAQGSAATATCSFEYVDLS